jgi:peptidoglycan/LPS O-acetylase OafA/YrhL
MSKPDLRFHALDATRAFALLLGVVFHAAWTFVPRYSGAPIVDVSGNLGFDWFFFASHTFRMQLFFLIAGFFARLLYQRRGFMAFAKQRLVRIAVPLVIGWFILYPLISATWTWGANASGRNLTALPMSHLLGALYAKGLMFVPKASGGLFSLAHLWFLYYLLWIYGLALLLRFLVTRLIPQGVEVRTRADRVVWRIVHSPWSVVGLSLGTGLFLWRMGGWFGVDTPTQSLTPSVPVLLLYGGFFGFGWLLHRQSDLLPLFSRHWKWQIPTGLALSAIVFTAYHRLDNAGVAAAYPVLSPTHIRDWPQFLSTLQSGSNAGVDRPHLGQLWQALPEASRAAILDLPAESPPDAQAGVCEAINKALIMPDLFNPAEETGRPSPSATPMRPVESGSPGKIVLANRQILEQVFAKMLIGDPRQHSWYGPVKLAYSIGYAVIMWLLVLGTLGFFHDRFPGHSPGWRYVADSSYWIYLLHIPLVPALQVWMAASPTPGVLKFLFLNGFAFALLFASYHYLVRSTFIGLVLNGRPYPFVAWPFGRKPPVDLEGAAASLEKELR